MTTQVDPASGPQMNRIATLAATIVLASLAVLPLSAQPQGRIGTIERGRYVCELPGDANSAAGIEQPGENFRIAGGSRYLTDDGYGTYLLRGDRLTMTSGPRKGDAFVVMGSGFLRKLENGEPGRLRCIRQER